MSYHINTEGGGEDPPTFSTPRPALPPGLVSKREKSLSVRVLNGFLGKIVSLWFDKWLNMGTLRSRICGPLNRGEEDFRLKDIASLHGWNWEGISFSFPKDILMEIKATPIPYSKLRDDRLSWSLSPSREFQLKDAYRLANANENYPMNHSFNGAWVWKVQSLPKIKCFL